MGAGYSRLRDEHAFDGKAASLKGPTNVGLGMYRCCDRAGHDSGSNWIMTAGWSWDVGMWGEAERASMRSNMGCTSFEIGCCWPWQRLFDAVLLSSLSQRWSMPWH